MTLDLLARAVSGTQVNVVRTTDEKAYVDGSTIALPGEAHADTLLVQAALLAVGSLTVSQIRALSKAGAAERYLLLEATRAAHVPWLLPRSVAAKVLALGAPATSSAVASADLARSQTALPDCPSWLGTIRSQSLRRKAAPNPEDDAAAEQSRILDLLGTPVTQKPRMLGGGPRVKGGGPGLSTEGQASSHRTPTHVVLGEPVELIRGDLPVRGVRYPEWDCYRSAHRDAWCTVQDLDPAGGSPPLPLVVDDALRRQLARIGSAPQRRRNLRDGDNLDLGAVVEHMAQRRLGVAEDPRVFEARTWTGRDLGVLVLLDATGSTAGHQVFDEQRLVAHRLASALSELGDRTAVYAFNSRGREDVRFLRVKDFEARYDEAARGRLASIRPTDYTRLGAAVRHGTAMLRRRAGTSHLLLVVIGDGRPYDDGYDDRYAREDSRAALREALAGGVGCVSLGVGTSPAPQVVDEVWGEVTHVHLEAPDEVDRHIREAFGSALRLATARRRDP